MWQRSCWNSHPQNRFVLMSSPGRNNAHLQLSPTGFRKSQWRRSWSRRNIVSVGISPLCCDQLSTNHSPCTRLIVDTPRCSQHQWKGQAAGRKCDLCSKAVLHLDRHEMHFDENVVNAVKAIIKTWFIMLFRHVLRVCHAYFFDQFAQMFTLLCPRCNSTALPQCHIHRFIAIPASTSSHASQTTLNKICQGFLYPQHQAT